jgi:hypothetical protein
VEAIRRGWTAVDEVLAEGVGFEPTRERNPLPVFKTGALNHSATLPSLIEIYFFRFTGAENGAPATDLLPFWGQRCEL